MWTLLSLGCVGLAPVVADTTDDVGDTSTDTVDTPRDTSGGTEDSGDDDGGTGGGGDADTDVDTDTDTDMDVACASAWTADGLTLTLTNGAGTYLFGMAEEVGNGWYGEDGFDGPGPNSGDWDINHDAVSSTGITLTTVHDPSLVVANSTTLLTNTIAEGGHLAYMLYSQNTGDCWEQNDDASVNYYNCR